MPDEYERRNVERRESDAISLSEIKLLRHEVENLQDKLASEEASDHRRLTALEAEIVEFKRKFNLGKGFFYGACLPPVPYIQSFKQRHFSWYLVFFNFPAVLFVSAVGLEIIIQDFASSC